MIDELEVFNNAMPVELAKNLPPKWKVDHRIELILGASPDRIPYHMCTNQIMMD